MTLNQPARRRTLSSLSNVLYIAVLLLVLAWVLLPFYWALLNSIKHPNDTFENSWIPWLQFQPTLEHWKSELAIPETRQALVNSTIISVGSATLANLFGVFAAYALARFHFSRPRNSSLTTWFLTQRVMPPVVVLIPYFLLFRNLGMLDKLWALILLNSTFVLPFPVIILSQMFRELPRELEEAAFVDGASQFQAFVRVALPLVIPGLIASWILCLAYSWNEFLFALTLSTKSARTMPVIIAGAEHTRGIQFWYVGVRVLLTMLPPTIMALLAQRYIIRGLTLGAVKG